MQFMQHSNKIIYNFICHQKSNNPRKSSPKRKNLKKKTKSNPKRRTPLKMTRNLINQVMNRNPNNKNNNNRYRICLLIAWWRVESQKEASRNVQKVSLTNWYCYGLPSDIRLDFGQENWIAKGVFLYSDETEADRWGFIENKAGKLFDKIE